MIGAGGCLFLVVFVWNWLGAPFLCAHLCFCVLVKKKGRGLFFPVPVLCYWLFFIFPMCGRWF